MARSYPTPPDVVRRVYADPKSIEGFARQDMWEAEAILVKRYFKAGEHVLDIACGPGRTACALTGRGLRVTGIDFLPEVLEVARSRAAQKQFQIEFLLMDANELSFPDDAFNHIVFFYNSVELIWGQRNRDKLLREIYRILKPGGIFIHTARSGFAFGKRWLAWPWLLARTCLLKPFGLSNPHLELQDAFSAGSYHRYQSPSSIRSDLRKTGFELLMFNSRSNIEQGRDPSLLTNCSPDRCLFFVARKPGWSSP